MLICGEEHFFKFFTTKKHFAILLIILPFLEQNDFKGTPYALQLHYFHLLTLSKFNWTPCRAFPNTVMNQYK